MIIPLHRHFLFVWLLLLLLPKGFGKTTLCTDDQKERRQIHHLHSLARSQTLTEHTHWLAGFSDFPFRKAPHTLSLFNHWHNLRSHWLALFLPQTHCFFFFFLFLLRCVSICNNFPFSAFRRLFTPTKIHRAADFSTTCTFSGTELHDATSMTTKKRRFFFFCRAFSKTFNSEEETKLQHLCTAH